jgi:hypothetical protein
MATLEKACRTHTQAEADKLIKSGTGRWARGFAFDKEYLVLGDADEVFRLNDNGNYELYISNLK